MIKDIDKLDDVGMIQVLQSFDLFVFFNLIDISIAMLHDFESIFMAI
jgi:hypothetical protein